MVGQIKCKKCHKVMHKKKCSCGNITAYATYYHEGKRYYIRRGHNNKSLDYDDALDALARVSISKRSNLPFDPTDYGDKTRQQRKFSAQMILWIAYLDNQVAEGELKPAYVNRLKSYDRTHFIRLYDYDLLDVNKKVIFEFKESLTSLKPKTRKNILSALRVFLTWFEEQTRESDLIKDYTVPPFPTIKGKDARIRKAMSFSDQQKHLEELPAQYRDVFEFAMLVGCRRGELCAYKVRDVDLDRGIIITERAWSDNTLTAPKNGEPSVKVLFGNALEIARAHIQGKHPEAWLFTNPRTGDYIRPKKIDELWTTTSSRLTFHEASRHSRATSFLEAGISPEWVQQLMGWRDAQSMKPYKHVKVLNIKAATERLLNAK